MLLRTLPLVFVLAGVVLYTVLAGADFGAGIWQLLSGPGERGERIREHAHESMGPVWEANHVWLIFVLTVTWTAYPVFFGSVASTLSVVLFIGAKGVITLPLLIYDKAIQESDYQAACAIAMVNIALSLGLFSLYRFAARRLGA